MKTNVISIFLLALLSGFLFSCTMEKRVYQKGYHVEWNNQLSSKNIQSAKNEVPISDRNAQESVGSSFEIDKEENLTASLEKETQFIETSNPERPLPTVQIGQIENNVDENNSIIPVERKILQKGKSLNHSSTAVDMAEDVTIRKVHWASILGFICGLASFFILGLILGIAAIVFSAIGLSNTMKHPEIYSGKGLAIAGLILGFLAVLIMLIYLATVV